MSTTASIRDCWLRAHGVAPLLFFVESRNFILKTHIYGGGGGGIHIHGQLGGPITDMGRLKPD